MTIPRIIHQTWNTEQTPDHLTAYAQSWKDKHPDWEYRLWTDEQNRWFIAQEYPWFLSQYDGYPRAIQRVDAVRYCILHRLGGLFVDLDFEARRSIEPLLEGRRCVFGLEPDEHAAHHGRAKIISNAFMAAEPGHPFLAEVIQRLPEYTIYEHVKQPVLETTGPFMLTNMYDRFEDKDAIGLVPSRQLYPLTMRQADELRETGRTDADLGDAYAVHYHLGTWWRRA